MEDAAYVVPREVLSAAAARLAGEIADLEAERRRLLERLADLGQMLDAKRDEKASLDRAHETLCR